MRLYFSLVGKCFVRFQVAFGLVGLPVLPKVFQQFAHFGGIFGTAGGFFGGVGGGFGGVPFGGVCIGQDAVGFVDAFTVFGKGVVQVLPSGGIGAGEFAFAVIDVFGVVGKAVFACLARCFAPGLRVAAFQGFAVEEDGIAVGGVEAVKQAECQGIGGLDFAAAVVGLRAVGGVAFAEVAEGGGIAAFERAQGSFVFAIYGIGVTPVALAEMGEAFALHGGKQFGAVVDVVAVAGNQAARFGEYFEGGGVAAA